MSFIKTFVRDEAGVTMLEYTILLAIITVATIGTIGAVGTTVGTKWSTFNTAFN